MADEARATRVTRAFYAADGHDPEAIINVGAESVDIGSGTSWARKVMAPAWTSYAGEARRFIAAAVALVLLE